MEGDDVFLRKTYVVYKLPVRWSDNIGIYTQDFKWLTINMSNLRSLFSDNLRRQTVFAKFLRYGFRGIVWTYHGQWISYAWISLPGTSGPPHLPLHIRRMQYYWIFYCRTREGYQGKGLYKASLSLLGRSAREADPNAQVYIDTEPDNFPSRKAIEAAGFVPTGVISVWNLRLPRISAALSGRWDKDTSHPEVYLAK